MRCYNCKGTGIDLQNDKGTCPTCKGRGEFCNRNTLIQGYTTSVPLGELCPALKEIKAQLVRYQH